VPASVKRPLSFFRVNPDNLRKSYDLLELQQLRDSLVIKQWVPLICGPDGLVYDGNRRLKAALLDGRPAELEVIILEGVPTVAAICEIQLVTSLARADLEPYSVYQGFVGWLKASPGKCGADLARAVGRSEGYVSMVLSLSKCIPQVQELAAANKIGMKLWWAYSRLSPEQQIAKLKGHAPNGHETEKVTRISTPVPGKKAKLTITGKDISLASAIEIAQEFVRLAKAAAADGVSAKVFEGVCKDRAKAK
jgi:ParB-like chromosome segregation protein Spo0J